MTSNQPPYAPQQGQQGYPQPPQQSYAPQGGYQQGPPPGWMPQPPVKKTHKFRNFVVLPVVLIIAIIVVASIASGGGSKDKGANTGSTSNSGISTGLGTKDATKDIKLGKIDATNGFSIDVPVSATNNSSKRSDYIVELSLESADGKTQYDTAVALLQNVDPGQTATDNASFIKQSKVPAGAHVVVKTVQRNASA